MISGHTRVFAILADPVTHVRTPQAFNALCADQGVDAVMVPFATPAADLVHVVEGLRRVTSLGGMVVTVPHKTAIAALCDRITDRARAADAVNVIRREADGSLSGDIMDGEGFAVGMIDAGISLSARRVYLAGAGGAASAIAFALASRGIAHLTISNRSADKAETLAGRLRAAFPDLRIAIQGGPQGHDIAVNGTSLGLHLGDALPFDPQQLSPGTIVAEVIMQPETTALLDAAEARGLRTHSGKHMLDGQLKEILGFLLPPSHP